MSDKLWLGIDPGKTTGYAILNSKAEPQELGQLKFNEVTGWLKKEARTFEAVVMESYIVYQRMAQKHTGSKLETSQVIGKIKFWAELNDIPVIMQNASILPMAQRWTQVKMPKDHSVSHQISAYLHGAYYLMKEGLAPSAIERIAEKQKSHQD